MNIVFFGSANFSLPFLKVLLEGQESVKTVVTQPDRPSGRGLKLSQTAVKELALESKLDLYQPRNINTKNSVDFLSSLNPDLFVVVAYGEILAEDILQIPKIFAMNVHASYLPQYRGAAPINWALIHGESSTGVTIMKMETGLDCGPIILQEKIPINILDNALILEEKIASEGTTLLLDSIERIKNNRYVLTPQDETAKSYAPKLKKTDGLIDWHKSALEVYNLIRGCINWPGAFTYYKGKRLRIYQAEVYPFRDSNAPVIPGEIVSVFKDSFIVTTAKENLVIKQLQIEGKRVITAGEFIAGYKIKGNEKLG